MRTKNALFIYSNGRVAALTKNTGEIIWEIKISQYVNTTTSYAIGQIIQEGDKLYIGISGIVLCLRTSDGSLVWKNELKGWGYSFVSMAGANISEEAASQAQVTSSTAMH